MRKLAHKRSAAIISIGGLLLAVIGVLLWSATGVPAFRFLGGCTPVYHRNARNHVTDVYSFESSFDEFCAKAVAELLSRGFREDGSSPEYNRIFVKGKYQELRVSLKNFAFEEATQDSISWTCRPGWVSVEVRRTRGRLWEYLPYKWQLWYQLHVLKSNTITLRRPKEILRRKK